MKRSLGTMYARREGEFVVLRQERYRAQLANNNEHPHDVCAIARTVDELHSMCDKHWPDADYSETRQGNIMHTKE
jgi:hypothetical protein